MYRDLPRTLQQNTPENKKIKKINSEGGNDGRILKSIYLCSALSLYYVLGISDWCPNWITEQFGSLGVTMPERHSCSRAPQVKPVTPYPPQLHNALASKGALPPHCSCSACIKVKRMQRKHLAGVEPSMLF